MDYEIKGSSEVMEKFRKRLKKLAALDAHVLIEGDTGTGKELAARNLHCYSARSNAPFVVMNCGAFSESLAESQLFGSVRGAFTGAITNRIGLCDAADGGILFLDEIGELPLQLQAVLLRFLDSGEVLPIGDVKTHHVNVRVIAATNRDLKAEIQHGTFREDLYYRLSMLRLKMPLLVSHNNDIPELAQYFLRKIDERYYLTNEAEKMLIQRSWPGNVRELRNAIWQAASEADGFIITPECFSTNNNAHVCEDLVRYAASRTWGHDCLEHAVSELTDCLMERAMLEAHGNKSQAAELLGIHRNTFSRLHQ